MSSVFIKMAATTIVFVVLFLVHNSYTFDLPKEGCNTKMTINDDHYNLTHSYDINNADPIEMQYDTYGNLFFVKTGRNAEGYYFNVFIMKEGNHEPQIINGLPQRVGYSVAVDKTMSKVYFGTGKGIYLYNYRTNSAEFYMDSDPNLNTIIIDKDGNKYVTESVNGVEEFYLISGKKKIPFHTLESLQEVAIDDHENFYFIKEEGLFVLRSTSTKPVRIGNVTYEGTAQITFHKNFVYVASQKLHYYSDNDTQGLKDVKSAPQNVTAITFDTYGNLVLGVKGKILKYQKTKCFLRKVDDVKSR